MNDFNKAQAVKIASQYTDNNIKKSEGARGGKVIGHTKSGKPIYEGKSGGALDNHYEYKRAIAGYSKKDHKDAHELHTKLSQEHLDSYMSLTPEKDSYKNSVHHHGVAKEAHEHHLK